jgi:hypothetical protein
MYPLHRAFPLVLVIAAACARPGSSGASEIAGPAGCVVRETSRAPLVIDGNREIYVEPTVVLSSGRSILLAGRPNYLFSAGAPTDERTVTRDSVFGVILDRDGRARLVPAPIRGELVEATRAIALPGGRWAALFGELKRPSNLPKPDTIARLWYGEFDGAKWGTLEQLPDVPGGIVNLEMGSELILRGDTLFAAVRVTVESSSSEDVAVFERRAGQWRLEVVPTIRAAYAELFYSDSAGLMLAVVAPDRSLRRDRNSLLLYARSPRWQLIRTLVHGGAQPVYDPRFTRSSSGTVMSWWIMDEQGQPPAQRARAMIGLTPLRDGRTLELDSDVNQVLPVNGPTRFPLWVAEHNDRDTGAREIRVLADSSGSMQVLAAFPSPFTGPFGVAAIDASEILVSGPLFHADPARPRLVSLLIRARVECRKSAP